MSEITDRLRSRCEAGRGRGKVADFFLLDDIEWLLSEYAQTEQDALDLIGAQNARAGLVIEADWHKPRSIPLTRDEAEAYIGE